MSTSSKTFAIVGRLPGFYTAGDASVLIQFLDLFGQACEQAETDLLHVMNAHWVQKADNEGSRGFDSSQKGDLDSIFSLYLENLGGTSELKQLQRRSGADGLADDALYRERIKGLIQVLMRGASTVDGIISIVAANLGIMQGPGATAEQVQAARSQIRIVEFLPDTTAQTSYQLSLFQDFTVSNTDPTPATPQIRVSVLPGRRLNNLTVVRTTGGGVSVEYAGVLSQNDLLSFFSDGTALLNGVPVAVAGTIPPAPAGLSTWHVEALLESTEPTPRFLTVGRFDVSAFDGSTADQPDPAVFAANVPSVNMDFSLSKLTHGFFAVYIPWDIPGFTEQFDQLPDNPRNQIGYIVNKVKAAGVGAAVVFTKSFSEDQQASDSLSGAAVRQPLGEEQGLDELSFHIGSVNIPYPDGIDQGLDDTLYVSGVFDYTGFDTLNTFA